MIQNYQNPEFGTRTITSSGDQWIHNGDYIRFIKFYVVYIVKNLLTVGMKHLKTLSSWNLNIKRSK